MAKRIIVNSKKDYTKYVMDKYMKIQSGKPYRIRGLNLLFEGSPVFRFETFGTSMDDVLFLVKAAYYEGWLQGIRESKP